MDETKAAWYRLPENLPVNCPYCGQRLTLVPSDGPTAYYACPKDGLLVLPPDGRIKKAPASAG
jgi:hypothetical protein